jgi:hypothetical protein
LGPAAFGAGVRQAVADVVRELVAHEETPRRPEVIGRPPREPVPETRPGPEQHAVITAIAMIGGAFGTSLEGDANFRRRLGTTAA